MKSKSISTSYIIVRPFLSINHSLFPSRFFEEIKTGLVPFMNNKVYGRSPLEAASFIVSSAFPDPKLHGASFLARLSGSTAEMLSMWAVRNYHY